MLTLAATGLLPGTTPLMSFANTKSARAGDAARAAADIAKTAKIALVLNLVTYELPTEKTEYLFVAKNVRLITL
ncbi:hypothetical protein JQ612_18315 [Bradyrhizobium manausense]|uniref:hypothetical protein n=1 Tax=Bradyrhizobium manausense TaxID=989370 RepID=UPI001BA68024|nr:hypothetical protein [Bradyrhizobium manausense]MBR0835144.1 hypothetical protein [Bradyrhizobium manausense]